MSVRRRHAGARRRATAVAPRLERDADNVPAQVPIHQHIVAQAARTPNAVAIISDDASMTYRELDERSNQLAHHLRRIGVGSESLVGICLGRSAAMVVAMVAIHKAGGAYVPLDPTYRLSAFSS